MNTLTLLRLAVDGNIPVVVTHDDPNLPLFLELISSGDLEGEVVGDSPQSRVVLRPRITAKGRARLAA